LENAARCAAAANRESVGGNLGLHRRPDVILHAHVLGAACLLAAAGSDTSISSRAQLVQAMTRASISVEFDGAPAREVFGHLQRVMGISIVGRYNDDRAGHGIDPEAPITLQAHRRPPIEVIELVLEQCADQDPCTWQIRNGYVEVGTKERLSVVGAMELRVYSIRDLLFEPTWFDNAPGIDIAAALSQTGAASGGGSGGSGGPGGGGGGHGGGGGSAGSIIDQPGAPPERPDQADRFDGLVEVIVRSVEPEIWEPAGGPATITPFGDTLVVRAPGFVHRQLGGGR